MLQFFGSWGGAWAFITPLIPMVFIFIYAVGMFRSGMLQSFENPSDAYAWYCGKWVSEFMDIFSIIMIAGIGLEKVTDVLRAVIYAGSPHIYFWRLLRNTVGVSPYISRKAVVKRLALS